MRAALFAFGEELSALPPIRRLSRNFDEVGSCEKTAGF